jgi:membrane protein implicated in regulation of membrane protease activity
MTIVYLACFIGGLLLAVRIMIAGVERPREQHPEGERTFRLSPPVVSAFAVLFGLIGYILTRQAVGSPVTDAVIAAVVAGVAAAVTARLVRDWWKVTPEHETDDERFVLQGHVARVTRSISRGVDGEVTYEIGAKTFVHPARGIDDTELPAGSEVVIERIEDGVAYVESWAEVEKRL